jgi:alpha-beta hydrolase superfamily lysophospholipase
MCQRAQRPKVKIGTIAIDADITLRRMVIHGTEPKGTVLLLHGFPETLYAWKDIALALANDYDFSNRIW